MADELDELYEVKPEEFTALRTKLAAAAKQRGDGDSAKQITAARKPTTAAWVVDDAARAAFEEAELAEPTGALRDDVTGTLQAAVADPGVASRLGRLTKAERWSGFGEFGDTAMVFTATRKTSTASEKPAEAPKRDDKGDDKREAARREREKARAALVAAERAKADADAALTELPSDLATARLRRDDARRRLKDAEEALTAAEGAYDNGKRVSRDAAALVKEAKAQLR